MARFRHFLLGEPASVLLVLVMLAGCLFLWIGVPVGWLWVGSQVQASASVGTALLVAMVGAIGTIIVIASILARVNRLHVELREAHEKPVGETSMLEVMLVVSAAIAAIGFCVWFLGFSGSSPVPLGLDP